jgi:hypothetical protein
MKTKIKKQVKKSGVRTNVKSGLIDQLKLNLACGKNPIVGYFGVDKVMVPGKVDAVVDLAVFPWPIKSDSTEDIICSHFVEHIPHSTLLSFLPNALKKGVTYNVFRQELLKYIGVIPDDGLIAFMNELHRIMKVGSTAKIISPYWSSIRCWQDPSHRRGINEATFLYFNKVWREQNGLDHYQIRPDVDFDYSYGYDISPDLQVKAQETKDFAIKNYTNAILDIQFILTKRDVS